MLVCVCGKTCQPTVGQQSANSGPTVNRQWADRFFDELFFTITELSFLCMDSNWVNFQQYSKRMSHLLRLWMTKTVSICSFISWGGFKFKSSIDQSYQRYGAYYDKRKKKLDFHYQPRNKVKGARLLWFTYWYWFQVISLHCKTKAQFHWVTLCATCSI